MDELPKQEDAGEAVLRVFQKENPSASPVEDDPDLWKRHRDRMTRRFTHEYRLPPRIFRGASVLDLGCGTGEKALVFASWGATVIGVDYNDQALERAQHLAALSRNAENLRFVQGRLPELTPDLENQTFDICHADGVLHHLPDPVASLFAAAATVAPGGWLIVRSYQSTTAFQRILKRFIVRLGCGEDDDQICENAIRLFSEDMERSLVHAGRPYRQSLYDNFVTPLYTPLRHRDVIAFCKQCGFEIYTQIPALENPVLLGPGPVTVQGENDERLGEHWAVVSLARAMMSTDSAAETLATTRGSVTAVSAAGHTFESTLGRFMDDATAEAWDLTVTSLATFATVLRTTFSQLCQTNLERMDTFMAEIEQIRPLIRQCLEQDRALEALPETSVLFQGMSGSPMAAWVLHKPDLDEETGL